MYLAFFFAEPGYLSPYSDYVTSRTTEESGVRLYRQRQKL